MYCMHASTCMYICASTGMCMCAIYMYVCVCMCMYVCMYVKACVTREYAIDDMKCEVPGHIQWLCAVDRRPQLWISNSPAIILSHP